MIERIPIFTPTYDFSVETYHKMADLGILKPTDKVELIEGKIVTRSPMKSPHAACVRRLGDILRHLSGNSAIVSEEKAITLGTHSEPAYVYCCPPDCCKANTECKISEKK